MPLVIEFAEKVGRFPNELLTMMPRQNKRLMEEMFWSNLMGEKAKVASLFWHAEALRETEQLVNEGKAKFLDWDEAKALLRSKVAKPA